MLRDVGFKAPPSLCYPVWVPVRKAREKESFFNTLQIIYKDLETIRKENPTVNAPAVPDLAQLQGSRP